ncbi:hypothetical protein MMC32_004122 [Xylographa parallela]|nr:hypothetical protein [Xylographa parallela]
MDNSDARVGWAPRFAEDLNASSQRPPTSTADTAPFASRPGPAPMQTDMEKPVVTPSSQTTFPVHRTRSYRHWTGIPREDNVHSVSERPVLGGYPKLADFLSRYQGFAIFRRFGALNTRNLLYLQVEILELEIELNKVEEANSVDKDHSAVLLNWCRLKESKEGSSGRLQYDIVMELRERLKEYNALLLEHHALYQLPEPSNKDVETIQTHTQTGYELDWLDAIESSVWKVRAKNGNPNKFEMVERDLVSLSGTADSETDKFTRLLRGKLANLFYTIFRKPSEEDKEMGLHMYSGGTLDRITGNVVVIVASILPVCSILALNYIPNGVWRLIFILIWSLLFSTCIAIFTVADRVQIFQASVAMAAVQVVFIGTNNGVA